MGRPWKLSPVGIPYAAVAGRLVWQRLLFEPIGWLLPSQPPEFGGRNATVLQTVFVYMDELSRRRIYQSFNPQGVNIIAASLLSFGSDEQKRRWAVPILRADTHRFAGDERAQCRVFWDLASLRTRAVLDGDHFVVNSGAEGVDPGAHDADGVVDVPCGTRSGCAETQGHQCIAASLTDTPGVVRRPFPDDLLWIDDRDFNEVFFTVCVGCRPRTWSVS